MRESDGNANSISPRDTSDSPKAVAVSEVVDATLADSIGPTDLPATVSVKASSIAIGKYAARRLYRFSLDVGNFTALAFVAGVLSIAAVIAALGSNSVDGYGSVLVESDGSPQLIVDVETAEWTDFAMLPGVGRTLAQRMVEARDAAGDDVRPETFEAVRGIGPKIWRRIEPFLKFPDR